MASMAFKPPVISSVTVGNGVIKTGATFILSVMVEDGGTWLWEDWDSSTWGEVSNMTWGA